MPESVLYIVATPIGNLGDMTPRAVQILQQVDVIAAEDTRYSKRLLNHFGIDSRLVSYHDHNEQQRTNDMLNLLRSGKSIALISDAGTPLISDPGYHLVRAVRAADIKVIPIPGACAIIAALSVSGLATDRFYFEGFLPAKSSARKKKLSELSGFLSTWGFYESTHRIIDSVHDCLEVLGKQRHIVLAREITKNFETVLSGTTQEISEVLQNDPHQHKGEFVVLVEGNTIEKEHSIDEETQKLLARLLEELPIKKAASIISDVSDYRKKDLYACALMLKK